MNDVVQYLKQNSNTSDMIKAGLTRTLVLYCGGTIGMKNDPEVGYVSVPGYMTNFLSTDRRFHDPDCLQLLQSLPPSGLDIHSMKSELGQILLMPLSMYGKRVAFQIYEYDPLKDSSTMDMDDWISMAKDVEKYYDFYDAFIIVHGTDTMAYSASALSFLLENLGKTVIFTGSQIPFSELRNDAYDNFLGALTLAGHYIIPEVTLFFHNRLLRGNRTSKVDAVDFNAFSSPNLKPLAKLGVKIKVEWHEILRPTHVAPFTVCKTLNRHVGALRLFPGIHASAIRAFSAEPMRGIVLETFGAGNAPQSPDFLDALRDAVDRGVIIVNVTQCVRGGAMNMYSAGNSLAQVGVIFGGDMTPECALTKLSYLLAHEDYDTATITRMMTESLRGEITIKNHYPEDNTSINPIQQHSLLGELLSSTLESCHQSLRQSTNTVLRPLLMHQAAANGDLTAMSELDSRRLYIDSADYQGKTCLHVAIANGKLNAVKWLIEHGANVHARDSFGNNAIMVVIQSLYRKLITPALAVDMIKYIGEAGGRITDVALHVELMSFVFQGDLEILELVHQFGGSMTATDYGGKNILHIAVLQHQMDIIRWIVSDPALAVLITQPDKLMRSPLDDAKSLNDEEIIQLFDLFLGKNMK